MEKISQHQPLNVYTHHYYLSQLFEFLNKILRILFFLVTPEDTSDEIGNDQFKIKKHHEYEILGGIKAVFWLVISFVFALLISQLK